MYISAQADQGQQQQQLAAKDSSASCGQAALAGPLKALEALSHTLRRRVCCGTCNCKHVGAHMAAVCAAAELSGVPDVDLLYSLIQALGSLGAALLEGNHSLEAHVAGAQALTR